MVVSRKEFIPEVKKHIIEEENGALLIDFTGLNNSLKNGVREIKDTFNNYIIEGDKIVLSKKLNCLEVDCTYVDVGISPIRRYSVGNDFYTVDKCKKITKIDTKNIKS